MRKYILWWCLMAVAQVAWCQQNITGKVYDAYTQAPLPNATVKISSDKGVATNEKGGFSLPCQGETSLTISYVGYETWTGTVTDCDASLQIGLTPTNINLNAVDVSASMMEESPTLEQPQSIGLMTRRELHRNTGIFLEQTLNLLPGVRMEKRTMSGGQRITIRGYGNNTNFNGQGYKAYINGIPITDAEGTTILDDIDFSTLGKVEVIKGPASSLYGTGIAGVVNMYTLKPEPQSTSISQEVIAGSYGLLRTNTRLATATDKSSILLNYGHQDYESYRVHSASKKDYVSFTGDFRPNDQQVITTYLSYNHSYEELAGQLDSAAFYNRENIGEESYLNNDGHVEIESHRAGVSHQYAFSPHVSNQTSVFMSGYTLNQAYAVGMNQNSVQNFGGRTEFQLTFDQPVVGFKGIIGAEYLKTLGSKQTYGLSGGILGGMSSENEINAMQYNIFTQWDVLLPADFKLVAGASLNFIEYGITDLLANTEHPDHLDGSGYKKFDPVVTPRLSLQKMFNENISAYLSVSQGYSPPTSSDAVISYTGEVNNTLKPERATQYELGSKGSLLDDRLSYQLALFSMKVYNKLTPMAVADNEGTVLYSYTTNGGDQINKGVELSVAYTAINNPNQAISLLRPFITYTYSHFRYDTFQSDENDDAETMAYSGNTVIGVPPVLLNIGVDVQSKAGIYLNASYQYVDDMYITYNNLHSAPSYALLSAKLGYKSNLGKHFGLDAYVGGNNLTNDLYYNMVFINWERGPQPSIYSPGAPKPTLYGGVNLKYQF